MIKECKKHGSVEHYERTDNNGFRCKVCNTERVKEHRRKKKQWCLDYLGGECQVCGYKKCRAALTFHHRDPSEKEFSFNRYQKTSYKKLAIELEKCDLLCSNCHMEAHWPDEKVLEKSARLAGDTV